jgi:hypothetical protein
MNIVTLTTPLPSFKNKAITLILIIIVFYISKPSITFKPNGKSREYGVGFDSDGYKKTFFTAQYLILIAIILLF